VKVMHPDAQDRFAHDFQVFRWVCRLALPAWRGMLDELEKRFMTEFDYLREAGSMTTVRSNLENSRFRRKVYIPKPVTELCTSNVLVMEMLEGKKLVDAMRDRLAQSMGGNLELASGFLESQRNKVLLVDNAEFSSTSSDLIDTLSLFQKIRLLLLRRRCRQYVDTLIAVHGHQILHDGFFNGDPHPGA
jgi:aarF domain-containing kinase